MERRTFLRNTALATAGTMASGMIPAFAAAPKKKLALVGTGHRGTGFWGKPVVNNFKDITTFVGLCDVNPGRLAYAKAKMGVDCPTFSDFEEMMRVTKPDVVIVTTVDATHDHFIVRAMELGADVITEKPMTTDDIKCRHILETEKKTGRKVIVGFNYRHGPHMIKIKELLAANRVGKITSVDFNWMLNVYHGADYFRRWHGIVAKSGSLWVHKASHHFDLLNWWLDSDPVEVTAQGALELYGKNNAFRGTKCRGCEHKPKCKFYKDITTDDWLNNLYVKNEQHDGYLRDGCVFRNEIDIWDKMTAQIKYANGVMVNYSLTTYSPYEGWRIAFNGKDGRLESWEDIPYLEGQVNQEARHAAEMEQNKDVVKGKYREIMVMDNFAKEHQMIQIPQYAGGHGGGDQRMQERIFRNPTDNPHRILAGTRDGAMSLLIGVAARKSIAEKRTVQIGELTDLVPSANRV
ncbi:Predicted dehydrogenase [Cnuella takakiae]|uniref:Predicted dehydrogenase n=1 Tax=Cnuella takakiae TaxID=1302690 RepID=A0A1M5A3B7_9BACT|nr:Gfo/Idh/MocA family oxidoreductase [Cnuella takakiae]OLY92114.1 4,5-dihydroxyphthalate dehydrogenase [Cnuella takakiae]SHF24695.1 Predicted dehydrogenase [Cnuella takakiae]